MKNISYATQKMVTNLGNPQKKIIQGLGMENRVIYCMISKKIVLRLEI